MVPSLAVLPTRQPVYAIGIAIAIGQLVYYKFANEWSVVGCRFGGVAASQ